MTSDLAAAVTEAATRWPDRPAWTFDDGAGGVRTLTFAQVHELTDGFAKALQGKGIRVGDRVGVLLPNQPEFPLIWLALAKLGAAIVPLNTTYRSHDLGHVLDTSQAVAVVTTTDLLPLIECRREERAGRIEPQRVVEWSEALAEGRIETPAGRGAPKSRTSPTDPTGVVVVSIHASSLGALDQPSPHALDHPASASFVDPLDHRPAYSLESLAPLPGFEQQPVDPGATVNVQFTSGTTGKPKGCLLSHRYWLTLGTSLVEEFPHLSADDVMLTAQPFSYLDPQWNVVAALLAGAHLVVLDGFHPSTFWSKVREHGVTYFYCLGAMPTLLLRMPPDPADRDHRVRVVQASAIPRPLHAELEERWGVGWYEAFGMTETGADLRVTDLDHDALVGTGRLGLPTAHREARVVDGELQLRGPGMMDGYLGEPDPFVDGGWFPTGDLARIDDDGRVYLLGRSKDMIRRSGENVAAYEVEDVIGSHPAVRLVAVVGVPDEIRGEEVKAFVVGDVDEAELAAYAAERLAAFKVPRYWEFRDDLPRTASERVAKKELLAEPSRQAGRAAGDAPQTDRSHRLACGENESEETS
ncbi:MAG: AMP-binding protein [Nocardioidaceae bacterium]